MNWWLLLAIVIGLAAFMPIATWWDVRLYKNKDTRHIVFNKISVGNDVWKSYWETNKWETFIFLMGLGSGIAVALTT